MTMVRSFGVLTIALSLAATAVIAPLEARDRPPSSNAAAAKQKVKDTAAAKGVTADTAKAKAANATQAQKDQAWTAAQNRVYQRVEAAAQKAKENCPGNPQCQAKVDQAKAAARAEAKREAEASVQWCKSNQCASDVIAAKAREIYYRVCPRYFNNC